MSSVSLCVIFKEPGVPAVPQLGPGSVGVEGRGRSAAAWQSALSESLTQASRLN